MSKPMHFLMGLLAAALGFITAQVVWAIFGWVEAGGRSRVDAALAETREGR